MKRVLSVIAAIIMIVSMLPHTAIAAENIAVVRLEGMIAPEAGQVIKRPDIVSANGDTRYGVSKHTWFAAHDNSYAHENSRFLSGVEYYYEFYLSANDGFSISKGARIYIGGEEVPDENLEFYSSTVVVRTKKYYSGGTKRNIISELKLLNVEQPMYGAETSCSVEAPDGAHFKIKSAGWHVYSEKLHSYGYAKYFDCDIEKLSLLLDITPDDGWLISEKADIVLPGCSADPSYTEISASFAYLDRIRVCIKFSEYRYPPIYDVTFDANGGVFDRKEGYDRIVSKTQVSGKAGAWPETRLSRSGYSFEGWFTEKDGGRQVDFDEVFTANTTLYAHWREAVDEVRIENVIMPMPGRKPVFAAVIPDGAEYGISRQMWYYGNEKNENYRACSSVKTENTVLGMSGKLLTEFENLEPYNLLIEVSAPEGKAFSGETEFYINGNNVTDLFSNRLSEGAESASIRCIADCLEGGFGVYNGAAVEIPAGIAGSEIEKVDLKNYINGFESVKEITVQGGEPYYISENRYILGTRPSSAAAPSSFNVTVRSESTEKTITVNVGEVFEDTFFSEQPQDAFISCGGEKAVFSAELTAASGETADSYKWYYRDPSGIKMDMADKTLKALIEYEGENTNTLFIKGKKIPTTAVFYCVASSGGKTYTSKNAKLTVSHNYLGGSRTQISGNNTNHTVVCEECGAQKNEAHTFKSVLIKAAEPESGGKYENVCKYCGLSAVYTYEYGDLHNLPMRLYITNKNTPDRTPAKQIMQYQRPLSYRPVREGMTFCGWVLDANSDTPDYGPEEEVFFAIPNLQLYAVWKSSTAAVGGKFINAENQNDVLGDGSVKFVRQTAKNPAKLVLENADIQSGFTDSAKNHSGIYSDADIEIELKGNNKITVGNTGGFGIFSSGKVTFSGDGSLEICSTESGKYECALYSGSAELSSGTLKMKDCKTAVYGDFRMRGGVLEILAGNYTSGGFKSFDGAFSADDMITVKISEDGNPDNAEEISSGETAAAAAAKYVIAAYYEPSAEGISVSAASEKGKLRAAASVVSKTTREAFGMFCIYRGGRLIGCKTDTVLISAGKNDIECSFELPDAEGEITVKYFLWDSLSNLRPILGNGECTYK